MIKKLLIILLLCSPVFGQWQAGLKPMLGGQINYEHPLAKGLVGCWLMNEGGDIVNDLSNNIKGTFGTGTAAPTWGAGKHGNNLYFDGSNDYIFCGDGADALKLGTSDFTIIFSIRQDALLDGYILSTKNGAPRYSIKTLSDGDLLFYISDGVNSRQDGTTWTPLADFKTHQVAWRVDHSRTDGFQWFIDGILDNTRDGDPTNVGSTDSGQKLAIGTRGEDKGEYGKFFLDYLYVYNRALSAQEVQQLYIDPFGMFRPNFDFFLYGAISVGVSVSQFILIMN